MAQALVHLVRDLMSLLMNQDHMSLLMNRDLRSLLMNRDHMSLLMNRDLRSLLMNRDRVLGLNPGKRWEKTLRSNVELELTTKQVKLHER